jgi:phosphoglycolate phosphatase
MNLFLKERNLPLIDVEQYKRYFEFPLINYYSRLGFDFNEESFEELGVRFIRQYKKHRFSADLFPGIKKLLAWLNNSGCSQFVVSAQEHSLLSSAVKHYNLNDFFVDCRGVDNLFAFKKIEIAKQLKQK